MELFLIIGGFVLFIVTCEIILWSLFRRRMEGIYPPQEYDTSMFRHLSPLRLRIFSFVHTIALSTLVALAFLFLW